MDASDLVARAQQHDAPAIEMLLATHERLVHNVARSYAGNGRDRMRVEDLAQECRLALLHALDRYDPAQGASFTTYAQRWMRQRCQRWCLSQRAIAIPERLAMAQRRVAKAIVTLECQGVALSDASICALANVSPRMLAAVRAIPEEPHAFECATTDGMFETEPADPRATVDTAMMHDELSVDLEAALATLTPRERAIVTARAQGQRLQEIASAHGITRERVRQIDRDARAKLRVLLTTAMESE